MKKLSILLILGMLVYLPLKAQVTPFKFEIGGLYGLPHDDAFQAGIGFYAHPSYYITDQINVGIKAEGVILGGADDLGLSVTISAIASYQVTANYYFGVGKIRPYVCLGGGLFSLGSVSGDDGTGNTFNIDYGNKFGASGRAGLDLGHFTLNAGYNMIFGIDSQLASKDYFSVGIGVFFGGGVKGKGGSKSKSKYITIDEDEDF